MNYQLTGKSKKPKKTEHHGLVQVYTGMGKGKTTAALGLGLRAAGHGFQVYMIQCLLDLDLCDLQTLVVQTGRL